MSDKPKHHGATGADAGDDFEAIAQATRMDDGLIYFETVLLDKIDE